MQNVDVSLTDFVLAAESLVLILLSFRSSVPARFCLVGFCGASFFGGIYHGFVEGQGSYTSQILWQLTLLFSGVTAAGFTMMGILLLGRNISKNAFLAFGAIYLIASFAYPRFLIVIIAILTDHTAAGDSYVFTEGVRRVANGASDPTALQAVEIDLWPTAYQLQEGHSVRLYVTGSRAPRYDNACARASEPAAKRSLHVHGEHSVLRLPIWHQ